MNNIDWNDIDEVDAVANFVLSRYRRTLLAIKEPLKLYREAEKARVYGINQTSANTAIDQALSIINDKLKEV